jgi:endonuclease/exonuclease/phosphatase family metal-dependent hydrolase
MNLERFSVATFNLYNLQLPGLPMNDNQDPWTKDEFKAKVAWTSEQLHNIDADIVGLQELWNSEALEQVLEHGDLTDKYDVLAEPAKGDRIICAALVLKGLLRDVPEWVEGFPDAVRMQSRGDANPQAHPDIHVTVSKFSRPVLRFKVALRDDLPLSEVFVTHLKSKLPTRVDDEDWFEASPDTFKPHRTALGAGISTIRRTAEAVALRVLLTDVMKTTDTPVLVLGDINDGQHSNTVNILTEQPSYLVGGTRGGVDNGLYTAQTLQEYRDSRDVYYTHVHQDLRESLDHILVSEQFYDNSGDRLWVFDGLAINNDHLNDEEQREKGTGDHGVVRVSFRYDPA